MNPEAVQHKREFKLWENAKLLYGNFGVLALWFIIIHLNLLIWHLVLCCNCWMISDYIYMVQCNVSFIIHYLYNARSHRIFTITKYCKCTNASAWWYFCSMVKTKGDLNKSININADFINFKIQHLPDNETFK